MSSRSDISVSDPDVRARFAVRKIHVEHIRLGDLLKRRSQFLRSVLRAKPFTGGFVDFLHFVEAAYLFTRDPEPRRPTRTFCAAFTRLRQPFFNRRSGFRRQACRLEIARLYKKVLRKDFGIGFEGNHAPVELRELALNRIQKAIAAERHFRAHSPAALRSLASQVERVGKKRRHPCALHPHVDAFSRRPLQPRPPIAAARRNLDSRICLVVRNSHQVFRFAPSLRLRMVAEKETDPRTLRDSRRIRLAGLYGLPRSAIMDTPD